jgi:hypothetical protein
MRERPKGIAYVHEVEGDKDIIVVIPTADFNGKYAINCRENIFKGLHMIFVESGGKDDFYFNFAHYVNIGIKKAMEYNPKWVVFSSDDMYKIDDICVLTKELNKLDSDCYDNVYTPPSYYHSIPVCLGEGKILRTIAFSYFFRRKRQIDLENKFKVHYFSFPKNKYHKFFFNCRYPYIAMASFGIFSQRLIKNIGPELFEETFINSCEDIDLDLRLSLRTFKTKVINFRIGEFKGSTLGLNNNRRLRDIAGYSYLNYKIKNGLLNNHSYFVLPGS